MGVGHSPGSCESAQSRPDLRLDSGLPVRIERLAPCCLAGRLRVLPACSAWVVHPRHEHVLPDHHLTQLFRLPLLVGELFDLSFPDLSVRTHFKALHLGLDAESLFWTALLGVIRSSRTCLVIQGQSLRHHVYLRYLLSVDFEQVLLVDIERAAVYSEVVISLRRRREDLVLRRFSFDLLLHLVKCELLIHNFGQDVSVFRVEEQISVHHVFLIHALENFLQPDVPYNEEEPVTHDEPSLLPEDDALCEVLRDVSNWLPMRSVLLQVSQQVMGLASLD